MGRILIRRRRPPTIAWTLQSNLAGTPGFNGYNSLHFDPVSQQTLLYGVKSGSPSIYSTNLFAYRASTNTWTDLGGTNHMDVRNCTLEASWPFADRHPNNMMAIDPVRNALWLSGGVCDSFEYEELWRRSLTADPLDGVWTEITGLSAFPSNKISSAIVYSPDDDVLVSYGYVLATFTTWVFAPTPVGGGAITAAQIAAGCTTLNTWTRITGAGDGDGAYWPMMVYDPFTKKAYAYAGVSNATAEHTNEMWRYDIPGKAWTRLFPAGSPPHLDVDDPNESFALLTTGPWAGRMIHHANVGSGSPKDYLYDPTVNRWTTLISTGDGPAVNFMIMTWDEAASKLIAFNYGASEPQVWHGVLS
jgi:hypothetical protein